MFDTDVVIAGAGPAGCVAAAALHALGLRSLVVDAPENRFKRLAGELLHPPAVEDLVEVGLAEAVFATEHQTVAGFAVLNEVQGRIALLPYRVGETGLSLEHSALVDALHRSLSEKGIRILSKSRVSSIESNDREGVEVGVSSGGDRQRIRARLLIAADGRGSHVRKLLGVQDEQTRHSTMLGMTVDANLLPHPGHGHIFVGGPAPVLSYAIGAHTARVMVDLPLGQSAKYLVDHPEILRGIPEPLRSAVREAATRDTVRVAANESRIPRTVVVGRVVLVGDAAGCSHPISASGLSSSTRDGRVLAQALGRDAKDISAALKGYVRQRRSAQRTRVTLAEALYRAFSDQGEAMEALREGLFRYWERTPDGAEVSMGLLSTREVRTWVMAREYTRVVGFGMQFLAERAASTKELKRAASAGSQLLASAGPHLRRAAQSGLEELGGLLYASATGERSGAKRAPRSRL